MIAPGRFGGLKRGLDHDVPELAAKASRLGDSGAHVDGETNRKVISARLTSLYRPDMNPLGGLAVDDVHAAFSMAGPIEKIVCASSPKTGPPLVHVDAMVQFSYPESATLVVEQWPGSSMTSDEYNIISSASYSHHQELQVQNNNRSRDYTSMNQSLSPTQVAVSSSSSSSKATPAAKQSPATVRSDGAMGHGKKVVLARMSNLRNPEQNPLGGLLIEQVHGLFARYGRVEKIVCSSAPKTGPPLNVVEAMVQYASPDEAAEAIASLNGQSCTEDEFFIMELMYSRMQELWVKATNSRSWDLTVPGGMPVQAVERSADLWSGGATGSEAWPREMEYEVAVTKPKALPAGPPRHLQPEVRIQSEEQAHEILQAIGGGEALKSLLEAAGLTVKESPEVAAKALADSIAVARGGSHGAYAERDPWGGEMEAVAFAEAQPAMAMSGWHQQSAAASTGPALMMGLAAPASDGDTRRVIVAHISDLYSPEQNPLGGVTVEAVHDCFSTAGVIEKIVCSTSPKTGPPLRNVDAMMQFSLVESAAAAIQMFDRTSLTHDTFNTMRVEYSRNTELVVQRNNNRARDYTLELAGSFESSRLEAQLAASVTRPVTVPPNPHLGFTQHPASLPMVAASPALGIQASHGALVQASAVAHASAGGPGSVIACHIKNLRRPEMNPLGGLDVDAIHTVFSQVGPITKIVCSSHPKGPPLQSVTALVQYLDVAYCNLAQQILAGRSLTNDEYYVISIQTSERSELQVKANNKRSWDYTLEPSSAAVAGLPAILAAETLH